MIKTIVTTKDYKVALKRCYDLMQKNIKPHTNYFSVIRIFFRDKQVIQIPNLLVSEFALQDKMYNCPQIVKRGLKFIRKNNYFPAEFYDSNPLY